MWYLPPTKGRVKWLLQLIKDLEGAASAAHEKGKNAYARGLQDGYEDKINSLTSGKNFTR